MSKILGIDYGDKRIGLAIAESESQAIAPYKIILNNKDLFFNLKKIFNDENIDIIIIGLPINLKSQITIQTQKVQRFINKLHQETKLPIFTEDERMTSKLYQKSGLKKVDALSAMSILDSYLAKQ